MKKKERLLGILFNLVMVLGLIPGMSLTAYADDQKAYAAYDVTTDANKTKSGYDLMALQVSFNGTQWYIIADNSTAADAGTVTLLAVDSFGKSRFGSSNSYSASEIRTMLDKMTVSGSFAGVANAIKTVKVKGSNSDAEVDAKLYLLSTDEANDVPLNVRKFTDKWWLRSAGAPTKVAVVNESGDVNGAGVDSSLYSFSICPALQLDLAAVVFKPESKTFLHIHSFTYTASGDTITATCGANGCSLPPGTPGGNDHVATLTISANDVTYDGNAHGATITDDNSIRGDAKILYQKKTGESYEQETETAPTDAGDYKASITAGGKTASVEYTIAKADSTANAPTGLTAACGQTLADVSLEGKNPGGNTPGTWAWADSTQSVGYVVSPPATFKATFTPDSPNYKTVENVEVTVTVSKGANPAKVKSTARVAIGGYYVDLEDNISLNGATGEVTYAISGENLDCYLHGSLLISDDIPGTVSVNVTVAADDNYEALTTPITVVIGDKLTQTITAEDMTVTYGDFGKRVSATTDGDGTISYDVKTGSEDYIDVNTYTGMLTIRKVPADGKAYVIVTAPTTDIYEQATKEVTVTINKANAVPATVSANNRIYDSNEEPLVTVSGSAAGGEMQYALGTETEATEAYTTSIPSKANAGTYYVWYKAVGDVNHSDSVPACVTVIIEGYSENPDDWNLFEDDSVHEYFVRGINVAGTVENSNARSKIYYDARLSGSTITVKLKGDRKKAAKAGNAVLEFNLGADGVVEYVIPVSYVKPVFKLSTASATIREGTERELKTRLLVKGVNGGFAPYDMKDTEVSGTGFKSVTKGDDGSIVIKADGAGRGKISISRKSWDSGEPVNLAYKVSTSKKDVLKVDTGNQKAIVINSRAKEQVFSYDILFNGSAPEKGDVKLTDTKSTGMATVSDNGKLLVSYKDGVKDGNYTVTLEEGDAKLNVKIRVNSKDLDKCIRLKVLRKLNIVTKESMMVTPDLGSNLNGSIEAVGIEEEGFSARLDSAGNIVIDYGGNKYTPQNLKIGTLTLKLKISGIAEPVTMKLNNVRANKTLPNVNAVTAIIPKNSSSSENKVIGTANIISCVKLANGRIKLVKPKNVEIIKAVNVKAKVNENDKTEVNIESMSKNTGSIKLKLTYDFDLTKTITVRVKKR